MHIHLLHTCRGSVRGEQGFQRIKRMDPYTAPFRPVNPGEDFKDKIPVLEFKERCLNISLHEVHK